MSQIRRSGRTTPRGSASPAPSNLSVTPGRRRRNRELLNLAVGADSLGTRPMPTGMLGAGPSSSYGSPSTGVPTATRRPLRSTASANDELLGILNPVRDQQDEERQASPAPQNSAEANSIQSANTRRTGVISTPRPSRTTRSTQGSVITSTPDDFSKSFNNESGVFGETTFQATPGRIINDNTGMQAIPEESADEEEVQLASNPGLWPRSVQDQWDNLDRIRNAERLAAAPRVPRSSSELGYRFKVQIGTIYNTLTNWLWALLGLIKSCVFWIRKNFARLLVLFMAVYVLLWSFDIIKGGTRDIISHGKDAFGSLIPKKHLTYGVFDDQTIDIDDILRRLSTVEVSVADLKKRPQLNFKDFDYLKKHLPDFIVLRKDRKGNKEIPQEFWQALKSKMQDESPILKDYLIESGAVRPGPAGELTEEHVRKIANYGWSDFLHQNEARVKAWQEEGFEDSWNVHVKKALKDGIVVSKSEFMDHLQHQWDRSQKAVKAEIVRLTDDFSHKLLNVGVSGLSGGLTERQVRAMAKSTAQEVAEKIKFEALAQAQLTKLSSESSSRPNHFSIGNGAVVDPYLTTPTFKIPGLTTGNFFTRTLSMLVGWSIPKPNPPITALQKWTEAGECWCAPATGSGPVQLAVLMKNSIYPDQVVIEHIASQATLDPGSVPRDFEIIAKLDVAKADILFDVAEELFPEMTPESVLDESYIRIGRFTYRPDDGLLRQSNKIQMDLKKLDAPTNKIVIRALNNGGADHTCLYRVIVHGDIAESG